MGLLDFSPWGLGPGAPLAPGTDTSGSLKEPCLGRWETWAQDLLRDPEKPLTSVFLSAEWVYEACLKADTAITWEAQARADCRREGDQDAEPGERMLVGLGRPGSPHHLGWKRVQHTVGEGVAKGKGSTSVLWAPQSWAQSSQHWRGRGVGKSSQDGWADGRVVRRGPRWSLKRVHQLPAFSSCLGSHLGVAWPQGRLRKLAPHSFDAGDRKSTRLNSSH